MSPHRPEVTVMLIAFGALLVLLGATVLASRYDLEHWNLPVTLLIAGTKAGLIVLYFMHLRQSSDLNRLVLAVGAFGLAILFTLSLADYWTRGWPHAKPATVDRQAER